MATITRGPHDPVVERIKNALDDYETCHPGATADVYRQNSDSVCIRIVDLRFDRMSPGRRHDDAWSFIRDRLGDDDAVEVSTLLLLTPSERQKSWMNLEFDDPIPSTL